MSIEQQEFEISDLRFQNQLQGLMSLISNLKFEISNFKFTAGAAMKYERFEDLPVWKAAAELAVQIFAWSNHA